jgi:NADH dehydrogenase [ubiquinone] 1 alpha subcomplex assembly factor 7
VTPLKRKILNIIRANGPISLSDYMMLALYDSEHGYYTTRDPFGAAGDFITAPEVSQIFGELLAAFLVQAWLDHGSPKRFHLVELGPGRGTLMADILRASRVRPTFAEAAHVTLVETSPALRAAQAKTLRSGGIQWVSGLLEIPRDAPLILVANEFFDAMPIRQYVKAANGWHERMVGAEGDQLVYETSPTAMSLAGIAPPRAADGAVFEISPPGLAVAGLIGLHIAAKGGLALIIDYGHARAGFGETFQAVKAHRHVDPLAEPGEADLTAHVDFGMLASDARAHGVHAHGPVTQKAFLESLGIRARAETLSSGSPAHSTDIRAAVERLTDDQQMGKLFKVLAISDSAKPPTGFP